MAKIMSDEAYRAASAQTSEEMKHWREAWISLALKEQRADAVESHPDMRGGIPVLKGTRIPVAVVLGELAAGASLSEIADDRGIDVQLLVDFLEDLAIMLDSNLKSIIKDNG